MEDKIIGTKGLFVLVADEGARFFDDLQKTRRTTRVICMLNQLFNGKGERITRRE